MAKFFDKGGAFDIMLASNKGDCRTLLSVYIVPTLKQMIEQERIDRLEMEKDKLLAKNDMKWANVCLNECLSEEFVIHFKHFIVWGDVFQYSVFSEAFLSKWEDIAIRKQNKTHLKFLVSWEDRLLWSIICSHQTLSESFIRKFAHKPLDWRAISSNQVLSESFIYEFRNVVDWNYIYWFQLTSREFIERNIDRYYNSGVNVKH